ncbi:uncharacterized protein LOC133190715 [Saccostrea echinata]|uniref:uncharacterized protein LOC133190715 n=1 Tax=Saccostrea echinata TaxID=191078 RepID=UPI002A83A551|nr:uncharacterized protein LOC133190715 [Saccostrea echinata]
MVNTCVLWGCTRRSKPGDTAVKFYDIPKVIKHLGDETEELIIERRRLWLARINRADFNPDPTKRHNKVCSDHFITAHLGPTESTGPESSKKRYDRMQARNVKKIKFRAAEGLLKLQESSDNETVEETEATSADSKPKCTFLLGGELGCTREDEETEDQQEIKRLKKENLTLKEKLCAGTGDVCPETFQDDEKVKHYTGLCYATLMALYTFLEPHITYTSRSTLTKFQKLVLTLMKLRHNFGIQDLGYRFKVTPSCVSKVFLDMIHIMYVRMKCFIYWPEREELQMSMPMEFRKYSGVKVSIITSINCFEVFIERPSNLLARAETWSNYKHHNTVKYLIGITPQGAISSLSSGYGGRVPDKHVTKDCGLLGKLLPGDIILADRGFNISESVGLCCGELKIPAFTRGKQQLSPLELESTRKNTCGTSHWTCEEQIHHPSKHHSH